MVQLLRDWRSQVLHDLGTMGIDAATLFPGLDAVVRQASMYMDLFGGSLPGSHRRHLRLLTGGRATYRLCGSHH
jgi:hypothetical protein